MEQKVSPRKRGSRPTITRAPFGFCEVTCRAIPCTARRTFAKVNSSAMTARHPDVPNLICVVMLCGGCPTQSQFKLVCGGTDALVRANRTTLDALTADSEEQII